MTSPQPASSALEPSTKSESTLADNSFVGALKELRKPVDPRLVKQREGWRDRNGNITMVDYVEWHTVADILDDVAPGWQHRIANIQQFGDIMTMTVALTIDGISREGVGCGNAHNEMGIKKAEHDALKRAAVKFGVARDLYQKETHEIETQGEVGAAGPDNNGFPSQPVARDLPSLISAKQLGMIRALARELRIDADEECNSVMSCRTDELSKTAASALIKHLQELQRPSELEKVPLRSLPAGGTDLHDKDPKPADEDEKAEAMRIDIDAQLKRVGIAPEEWLAKFDTNCKTFEEKQNAHRLSIKHVRDTQIKLITQSWEAQGWNANDRLMEQRKYEILGNLNNATDEQLDKIYNAYITSRLIIIK